MTSIALVQCRIPHPCQTLNEMSPKKNYWSQFVRISEFYQRKSHCHSDRLFALFFYFDWRLSVFTLVWLFGGVRTNSLTCVCMWMYVHIKASTHNLAVAVLLFLFVDSHRFWNKLVRNSPTAHTHKHRHQPRMKRKHTCWYWYDVLHFIQRSICQCIERIFANNAKSKQIFFLCKMSNDRKWKI